MSFVIPSIFTAVDNFSGPIKGMAKAMKTFGNKAKDTVGKINESFDKAGKNLNKGIKAGLTGIAIASPLIVAGKAAIDYEDRMAGVAKTTGLAGAELEQYSKGLLNIAKGTRTSIEDLQTIGEIGGQLGVANNELLAFTDSANKFAVALGSDYSGGVEQAITQVGKIKNLFEQTRSIPIADVINKAGSAINELGAVGAGTSENINDFVLRIGALPSAIKPTFTAAAALGTFFEEVGIDSQIASGGLSNFLLVAGKNIGGFANQMGVGVKAAQNLLAQDPTAFAVKFASSLNKMTPTQLAKKLQELRIGSQETIKVLGALGGNASRLAELQNVSNKAFADGVSLQIEYAKVNSTTAAKLKIAKNNFDVLAITIGTKLIPLLVTAIDKFTEIASTVLSWVDHNDKLINRLFVLVGVVASVAFVISAVNFAIATYRAGIVLAIALKWAWIAVIAAFNFIQGVSAAIMGTVTGTLIANKAAMYGVMAATKIATAAQWLWNAALSANPIGLLIIGIVALIAVIVIVIKKWDSWGQAVAIFLGPLGMVISLFVSFYRNWEMIKKAFKTEGILGGLKAIGKTLLDAVLSPLQKILEIAGKLPGKLGQMAKNAAANIEQFRKDMGVTVVPTPEYTDEGSAAPALNTKLAQAQAIANSVQTVNNNNTAQIEVSPAPGANATVKRNSGVPIKLTKNVASWVK